MGYNDLKRNQQSRRLINRYKTVRDRIIKTKCSITFLIRCRNKGIVPKFIKNSTKNILGVFGNNGVQRTVNSINKFTQDLQRKMLNLAIRDKHDLLKHFQGELIVIELNLRKYLTDVEMNQFLEFENKLSTKFTMKIKTIQKRKFDCLQDLQRQELGIKFNENWFVNKTNIDIPTDVKWTLSLGHKFALPFRRRDIPTLRIIADGEDLIQTLDKKEEQDIARTRLTTIIENHLNKIELNKRDRFMLEKVNEAERFLKRNKNIIILKADKGNTTVALHRDDYNKRMRNIVDDTSKYNVIAKDPTSKLQKLNNGLVDELFKNNNITKVDMYKLKTSTAIAPRLYGLPKIHKKDFPLRPICSFINSPSYFLCKYVTGFLKKITENSKYNVKDSVQFKERVMNHIIHDDEELVSFDVISLFPSIPVRLAISIIEEKWSIIEKYTNINKQLFLRILSFCIEQNRYFKYNEKIYIQHEGLPMGSPASPVLADIVMEKLLDDCIGELLIKPRIMTKYVDDLFCIIPKKGIEKMLATLNNFSPFISFTIERENNFKISYLDTLLIRKGRKLVVDWYQKPTASGRLINYFSKHSKKVIINTAKNLIERVLKISDKEFHKDNIVKVRNILIQNSFPLRVIYRLIRQCKENMRCMDNVNVKVNNVNVNSTESKLYKSIIYIPVLTERLKMSGIINFEKYNLGYTLCNTLGRLFSKTKDKIEKWDKSNLVYMIPCKGNVSENCEKVYVGTTKNKLKTRIAGHKSDQKQKHINSQKTALSSHCSKFNHYPNFENVSIINVENNYKKRLMLEMLQINNVPTTHRINFKADTENLAQTYRHLINRK